MKFRKDPDCTQDDSTQKNQNIAITGVQRLLLNKRESAPADGFLKQIRGGLNLPAGFDNGRYSRVGGPYQVPPVFYCPEPRNRKMLIGRRAVAIPAVIGQIHNQPASLVD